MTQEIFTKRYTSTEKAVYAISLKWPDNNILLIQAKVPVTIGQTVVTLLGYDEPLVVRIMHNITVDRIEMNYKAFVYFQWNYQPVKELLVVVFPGKVGPELARQSAWTVKFSLVDEE